LNLNNDTFNKLISSKFEIDCIDINLTLTCPPRIDLVCVLECDQEGGIQMMRRSYTPERIINKLREAEVLLSQESKVGEAARTAEARALRILTLSRGYYSVDSKLTSGIINRDRSIERLRQIGYPKALQHHLGNSSPVMVMRYLSTLPMRIR